MPFRRRGPRQIDGVALEADGDTARVSPMSPRHTGWVHGSLDGDRITAPGKVFRVARYHENHPDKHYKIANPVEVLDGPRAIAWKPGTESPETGELSFGGWIWRYDLEASGSSQTIVTLTYDWSAVPPHVREYLRFPPFGPDHLDGSLQHLSDLIESAT
jgi:hypothetical protein